MSESLDEINGATYAVFGETIANADGSGAQLTHFQIGTARAVDEHVLVTNAHVTQAFARPARPGSSWSRPWPSRPEPAPWWS